MIITEIEKTKVVFSSLFDRHYPELFNQLAKIMCDYHRGFGYVCHTKDYWVRDFMPIQMEKDVFAKFIFNPDYLQDKKKYITDVDKVINNCPFVKDFTFVNIPLVMDGGNMVFCKGYDGSKETSFVIMTEKELFENPNYNKQSIEALLMCVFLEPDLTVVWLPWDRKDTFGHTDGIARFIDTNKEGRPRVLVNLELYEDDIANQMYDALAEHFEVIGLKLSEYEDLSWAYINCLQTMDFIIIPGIGNDVTDTEAVQHYNELFPHYKEHIYMVQMRDFIAEQGGALNCLTWTFYENTIEALLSDRYSDKNMMAKRNIEPVQLNFHQFMMELSNDEANA